MSYDAEQSRFCVETLMFVPGNGDERGAFLWENRKFNIFRLVFWILKDLLG